jgi:hypothetical protein
VVSRLADQTTGTAAQLGPITFAVWDPQHSPVSVSAFCSDTNLVSDLDIQASLLNVDASGTNFWSLTLVPSGVNVGKAKITVVAIDGLGLWSTASFFLTVGGTPGFLDSETILIPGDLSVQGRATPYRSVISVSGLTGVVNNVQVVLNGFTHPFPRM